jgi:hypothetical protein
VFEQDLSRSKRVTYEQWRHRPVHERFTEALTTMFGFML